MPTSLENWFNNWYYNVYTRSNFTTSSTAIPTEEVVSNYTFYYTPWFDIQYKPKKRKLDLE